MPRSPMSWGRGIAFRPILHCSRRRSAVDMLSHSLQPATRALRADESDEYVVCALLHDIGDTLAPMNHADVAASIVKPWVSADLHWMVENHGEFQAYYFVHI